jgi:hypothetical protein
MKHISTALLVLLFLLFGTQSLPSQPNCSAPQTGYLPLNVLGNGTWNGMQGGLYPGGSNVLPAKHRADGNEMMKQVLPLDRNGNPNAVNGRIVLITIGMSNTAQESAQFIPMAMQSGLVNPRLVLLNGAVGGMTAQAISTPGTSNYINFWKNADTVVGRAGCSNSQVQVVWYKQANIVGNPSTMPHQVYQDSLVVQGKRIMNILKAKFPNLKLCFLSNRIYGGYASTNLNPEPYAYRSGFACKKIIEDQINGDPSLRFSGVNPPSPWLSWGPDLWADGITANPRTGISYVCPDDFANDGVHPSTAGAQKVARALLNFFTTDSMSCSWFNKTPCSIQSDVTEELNAGIECSPNPFTDYCEVIISDRFFETHNVQSIVISDVVGREVCRHTRIDQETRRLRLHGSDVSRGINIARVYGANNRVVHSFVIILE